MAKYFCRDGYGQLVYRRRFGLTTVVAFTTVYDDVGLVCRSERFPFFCFISKRRLRVRHYAYPLSADRLYNLVNYYPQAMTVILTNKKSFKFFKKAVKYVLTNG